MKCNYFFGTVLETTKSNAEAEKQKSRHNP